MKNAFLTPSLENWFVGVICMFSLFVGNGFTLQAQTASTTYTGVSTFTVPSGVTSITIKAKGGAGGYGGNDGLGTGANPGGLGYVEATYSVSPGDIIGIYPGFKGSNGSSSVNNSGAGAGGSSTYGSYSGGWGGNAASSGNSGGGGGGGAATIVTKNSSLIIVAAGAGGGGGAGNCANSATNGSSFYINNGSTFGGNGNSGSSCGQSDGGGGGGGGGGANGGSGGLTATTSCGGECGGIGGYIGSNSVSGALSIAQSNIIGNTDANGDVIIEYTVAGGTASANQTLCAGNTPASLTLSGFIGNIQWQVSTNNSTWSDISGATSATLSSAQMGALTATRYYRAWISGVVASNVVTITVNPVPSPMTISNNLCTPNQINWATMTSITPTTATGVSQSGITISVTQSGGGMETESPGMYNASTFPAQYNVPSTGSIIRNLNAGVFTACFSQAVTDPYFAFASIGNPGLSVPIITSAPYQMIWTNPGTITQNSATQFTGSEGFAVVKIPGSHTCVSFNYTVAEYYSTIAFGFGDQDCTAPTLCNGGSVTLTATGSTNYVWTPSTGLSATTGASVVASPTVATTYQVTNPDDACAQPVSILVNVNPSPVLSSVTNKVVCRTTSIPAQSVTSSISGTTFAWTNSNTAIGLAASGTGSVPTFTTTNNTSAPITATITITGTAPTGCQSTVTYTITVNPTPTVNQPTNQTVCAGASTAATSFTGSTTGATYTWSNSNTAIGLAASGTGNIPVFTATNGTNATISSTVTVTPSYGATGSLHGEVSQNGTLNLTAPTGTVFTGVSFASYGNPTGSLGNYTLGSCNAANSTSVVSGLAIGNTSVSIPATDATFAATACSGSNSLVVVLTYGPSCQGTSQTFTYTVNPGPIVTTTQATTICTGTTFTVTPANGGGNILPTNVTYAWSAPSVAGITGTAASTGASSISGTLTNTTSSPINVVYSVTPTSGSCQGVAFPVTVTVNPTISIANVNSSICSGSAFTTTPVNGAGTDLVPNGTQYTWTVTPSVLIAGESNQTTALSSVSQTLANNGTTAQQVVYTVTPQFTNSGLTCIGTPFTNTVTVMNAVPTVSIGSNQTICQNTTASFTATTTNASSGYWSTTGLGTISPNLTNSTIVYTPTSTESGTVQITYFATNICGNNSASANITINTLPSVAAITGNTMLCASSTSTLSSATTGGVWSSSNTGVATISSTGIVTGVSAGTTTITYAVTTAGCTNSVTTVVTVNQSPITTVVANGPTSFCPGGSVTLTAGAATSYLWSNNATTQSISVTTAGSYTATLTNAFGCSSTSLPVVVSVFAAPTATITAGGSTTICQGANVTLNANAGTGLSYQWNNNTNNQSLVVSAAGSYTVTVTDANGCSATSTATTITVNPLPTTTSIFGSTALCVGTTTILGTTSLNPTWSSSNTAVATVSATGVVTGVTPGTANITYSITNANGCSNTASATVTVSPLPSATIATIGSTTFCQGGNVTLLADNAPSGSTFVYQWRLNGTAIVGATANTYVATTSGNYSVTITANNLCQATSANTTVTVNPLPVLAANTGATSVCQGSTTSLANTTATGLWTSSDNTIATINPGNGLVTGENAGTVTLTYTFTNANGCTNAVSTNFTVNALPTAAITANGSTTFCIGGNVTLTASTGTSYSWSNGATTASIVASTSGNYVVTVTNANGCSSVSTPMTVIVNPLPVASITANGPTTFCQGGNVTLVASTGVAYLWSTNNAITQSNTITSSGTYSVTVTNSDGCSATSAPVTVTVNALPTPTITASSATTFCQGGNVTLTASAGTAYLWSSGETSQSIIANVDGPYSVQVTNANGCIATSANTNLVVYPLPTVAAITGSNAVCEGSTVVLASTTAGGTWSSSNTAAATISSTGIVTGVAAGNAVLTYSVTDGNACTNAVTAAMTVNAGTTATISASGATTFCAGGNVTLTASPGATYEWSNGDLNQSITISNSGSYYVIVTNASGCSSTSATTQVIVNPLPVVAAITGSSNVCVGATTQLADATTGGVWTSSNANIATVDATGLVTTLATGTTTITYTVTNANGCTASVSETVTVNALPAAIISANGATTFCQGSSVTLVATAGTNYLWNNGQITQSITVDTAGTYFVTITNAAGCTANSNAISIVVNALPTAVVTANGPTTFCQGNNVLLTATGGSNYLWSTGETTSSILVSTSENIHVDVTNANGCTAAAANTIVTVLPVTVAAIAANGPTAICLGSNVTLTATAGTGLTYLWSNGVTTANTQNITVNNAGVYTVTVTNASGCTSTASQTVTVNANPAVTVTANGPTLFCQGGSVTLTASGAASYVWNTGDFTSSITVNAGGSYFVVGTSAAGCETTSATTVVTTSTIPVVAAITGANNVCEGGTINLTSSTNNGTWTSANNFIATVSNSGIVTGLNAGTTTISYTVTNGACSNAVTAVVNVMNNPVVPIITPSGATTMCPGGTVILFASNAANYEWSNGPSTPFITVNQSGNYAVTVTNTSGCSSTSLPISVFIGDNTNPVIVPPANITMAPNFGCEAIGVNLGAPNATDNCSVATVSHDAPAIFPLGLTTVTWTVVDGSGNTSTATQLVNVVDNILPIINVNDITVIINDNGSTTITFEDVNTGTTDNCGIASMTLSQYTFGCADIGDNNITVTVTDNNGNVATTTIVVTVVTSGTDTDNDGMLNACDMDDDGDGINDANEVVGDTDGDGIPNTLDPDDDGDGILTNIEGTDDIDGDGVSNYLDTDSDGDGVSDDFEWDFGGLGESGQDCDNDGVYDFLDTDLCGPVIPEAFTPNGNGFNDNFVIPGIEGYKTRQVTIYSRYGTKVYESAEYNNDWDGTLLNSGTLVPDGTYYYIFTFDNGLVVNGYVYINRVQK